MVKIHQFKFRFRGTAFLPWYRFFTAAGMEIRLRREILNFEAEILNFEAKILEISYCVRFMEKNFWYALSIQY